MTRTRAGERPRKKPEGPSLRRMWDIVESVVGRRLAREWDGGEWEWEEVEGDGR
jgi:hypothetical protein